LLGSS